MVEVRQVVTDKRGVVGLVVGGEIHIYIVCTSVAGWLEEEGALISCQGLNRVAFAAQCDICSVIKGLVVNAKVCRWQVERVNRQVYIRFRI